MGKRPDAVAETVYSPFLRGKANPATNSRARLSRMYRRILMELCLARFKWTGLPDTIDIRFMETVLLRDALAVFYWDHEYDRFMVLRAMGLGNLNMYDNPTEFTVYGNAMLNKKLSGRDCVPIWANKLRIPEMDVIHLYARRLAELDRTIDINQLNTRHPVVFAVDVNERLSMVNAFRKVQEGEPVIFGTEMMGPTALGEKVSVFNTGQDKGILTEILDVKTRTWNEAMTLLGIMNVNSQKRERMVVEEAAGASGMVLAFRGAAMGERQAACERINKMYNLNCSVEWSLDEDLGSTDLEGMNPDGVIHA